MLRYPTLLLIFVLALTPTASAQISPAGAPALRVSGPTGESVTLSAHDLDAMRRVRVNVVDEKGTPITYEGVPLIEILRRVGTPTRKDLRGQQMALYLLIVASDGYRAVFALAELDPVFTDRQVLLVDRRDGKPLSSDEGPFRIVVPGEKRHARWVHQVTSLTVKTAE